MMKGFRARVLYDAGFKSISHLAIAEPNEIYKVLVKSLPFQTQSSKGRGFDGLAGATEQIEGNASRKIVAAARDWLLNHPMQGGDEYEPDYQPKQKRIAQNNHSLDSFCNIRVARKPRRRRKRKHAQ